MNDDLANLEGFFTRLEAEVAKHPTLNDKRNFILDDQNRVVPATMVEHMRFMAQCEFGGRNRVVAKTEVKGIQVSTMFLGYGKQCIFETMISGGQVGEKFYQWKTWQTAEVGHMQVRHMIDVGEIK